MYPVCLFVCLKCVHTFTPQHSSVWAAYFQEHTSCVVSVSMSHRSLNTEPMSCMWIGRFSAGSDSWGGWMHCSLPRQTAAPFPCPHFQQCGLVQHPPPLNVSTHVTTSGSHHKICVGFFTLFNPKCVCYSALEDWSVYLWHIYTSPLFMFPIISTFCKNAM